MSDDPLAWLEGLERAAEVARLRAERDALRAVVDAARTVCDVNAAAHSARLFGAPADVRSGVVAEWRAAMRQLEEACGWVPAPKGETGT